MVVLRGTRLLVALVFIVGIGALATAPASAGPALSQGCTTLHALEPDQLQSSSGHLVITGLLFATGEVLRVESVADSSGTGPFVTISTPGRPDAHLSGSVGDVMTYALPVTAAYTIDITTRFPPATTTVQLGCGVPPSPVATLPVEPVQVGEHVEVSVSCEPGTNPLASCKDSYGSLDVSCRETGCVRTLDTAIQGSYLFQVTGTDSRGLVRTQQFWYEVVRRPQSIEFTSTAPTGATYGGPAYDVGAVAVPSGLTPVVFTSGRPQVCQVSGTTVSFVGVGTCLVRASQAGDNTYEPAPVVTQSFEVGRAGTTLAPSETAKGVLGLTPTTFSAVLTRGDSTPDAPAPVGGQTVSFAVAGKSMCSAVTDAQGVATCTATIGLLNALREKTYSASFAGSTYYEPATAVGALG